MIKSFITGNAFIGSNGDRFFERQIAQSRHAHQFRHAVDFRRTRAAFARFAVPAAGEVVRLRRLNVIHRIEHDHSLGNAGRVIAESAAVPARFERASPYVPRIRG